MLIIAYERDETFLQRVPFPVEIEPRWMELDRLLADPKLLLLVTNDLLQSAPQAAWNGRPATPVDVTLRLAVLRRLMDWSYRTVEDQITGNVIWRWFCHIEAHAVPDHSTIHARERLIQPATVHKLHERVVKVAIEQTLTRGRQLRTDGTVIETNIHYPSDSHLLSDSVRVLGRLLQRARGWLKPRRADQKVLFRNATRKAKRLAYRISHRLRARDGKKRPQNVAQKPYRQLLKLTQTTLQHARQIEVQLGAHAQPAARHLAESLAHYMPLVQQVIEQTEARVFQKKTVPATQKVVSLFEPHTAVIRRGRPAPRDTEFGRKVWFSEVDGGIISDYRLLPGNPPDAQQWPHSLQQHQKLFAHPPDMAVADRGVFSLDNEQLAQAQGIEQVALPQPGAKSAEREAYEAQPWFKAALKFRAGIEGRISGLKRARGLDRCLNHGEDGMLRWLGWSVITNNLVGMATQLARRHRTRHFSNHADA